MQAQIKLGRIRGIEIRVHYSWLIIAVLIATSLAGHFNEEHPNWPGSTIWSMAILTALLFFGALILHELAHAAVARLRGLPVRSITLFALGGVAQIDKEAGDAKTEFWMSMAGPLMSALIGAVCLGTARLLGWSFVLEPATPLLAMLVWLGYINLGLAIFNLTPGLPLDGGRILRAVIWWITGNANRATLVAAATGKVIAYAFILLGILLFFGGAGFSGLWMAFIGWFLLSAAQATTAQAQFIKRFDGVQVADLMTREWSKVDGNDNLRTFVNEFLLRSGQGFFLVLEKDQFVGLITLDEVKAIPQARWPFTTVSDVMVPLERSPTVTPETPVADALELIGRENIQQLPVVSNGRLEGMISRDQIMNQLVTRAALKS